MSAERIVRLAARAAARRAGLLADIMDEFGVNRHEEVLRLKDHQQELDEMGHFFDPNCTRPTCVRAAQFLAQAQQQIQQPQGPVNG